MCTETVRRRPSRAFRGTSTCSSRARRRRSSFFAGQVAEARRRRCPVEPAFAARRRRPVLLRTGRPQYLCRQPPSPPPRNVSIRVPVSTASRRFSGRGATLSYCYIVTERHTSPTSSPTTSNSTIAARSPRGSVSHNFAQLRSCTARGVVSNDDGAHSPSTSSFAAATSSRALLEQGRRRGQAPRVARYAASSSPRASLYRER